MLHPRDFKVNEVWIAFRVNDAPVRTKRDGDFHCIVLMDAASCYILSSELIPVAAKPTTDAIRGLFKVAQSRKGELPQKLFVENEEIEDLMTAEATHQNIEVVRHSERELRIFTREVREGYAKHLGKG